MFSDEKKILTFQETKDKALRLLEFRSHSERELSDKLKKNGATNENIDKVLSFAREYNLVNDEDYAKRFSRDLANLKKYGKYRIKSELYKKGIAEDIINIAISELETDEEIMLLPLITKKIGGNFEKKNIDKAIRYFLYRGYSFDDIKKCISQLKSDYTDN